MGPFALDLTADSRCKQDDCTQDFVEYSKTRMKRSQKNSPNCLSAPSSPHLIICSESQILLDSIGAWISMYPRIPAHISGDNRDVKSEAQLSKSRHLLYEAYNRCLHFAAWYHLEKEDFFQLSLFLWHIKWVCIMKEIKEIVS